MTRKIIGIAFIVAAIFGLIFSIAGIALVWGVKAPLTESLLSSINLIDTTLEATSSGLAVVDETLTKTLTDLTALESTLQTAGRGVDDSVPMVESISGLLSGSIPDGIEATQTALTTLQDASATLESTLQLITSIPFLPIQKYEPDVSFTTAIEDVSQSLNAIPESLGVMEGTLNSTQGNLTILAAQVRIISRNISELKSSVYDIQLVLGKYQEVISTLQEKMDLFRSKLFTIITVTAWVFTIIFIWLGIAQLGLLTQGLERVDWPRPQQADEEVPLSEAELEGDQVDVSESDLPAEDDFLPESDQ
jgi:methyl-accepting chemotaxis protein